MPAIKPVERIAVVGTGVIGASWTALFLAKGLHVIATDPAPQAEASLKKFVEGAWPALRRVGLAPGASQQERGLALSRDPDGLLPGRRVCFTKCAHVARRHQLR